MDYQKDSVGRIVLEARKTQGRTQVDLAKRLKVDPIYISNIENNRHLPSVELGADLAKALQLNPRDFIFLLLRSKHPRLTSIFI